jgi:hypothetical protein
VKHKIYKVHIAPVKIEIVSRDDVSNIIKPQRSPLFGADGKPIVYRKENGNGSKNEI